MGLCLISAKEIETYRRRWNAYLIDLRDPEDYRQWHIPGARNVPVEELEAFMEHASNGAVLIFYCQHGNASVQEGCRYVKRDFEFVRLPEAWMRISLKIYQ